MLGKLQRLALVIRRADRAIEGVGLGYHPLDGEAPDDLPVPEQEGHFMAQTSSTPRLPGTPGTPPVPTPKPGSNKPAEISDMERVPYRASNPIVYLIWQQNYRGCASRSATRLDNGDFATRSDGAVMATAPCEAALQTSWSCPSVVAWCFVRSRLRRTAPRSRPRPAPASPTAACLPRDPGAPSSARRPCCHLAPRSHRRCRHARGAGRPAYPARHTAR